MSQVAAMSSDGPNIDLRLFEGKFYEQLGLERDDLRLGLDVAKNLIDSGKPQEAIRLYAALCLCDPLQTDYQVGLANCALLLGEYEMAVQAASVVIASAPSDPRGYYLSGRACLGLGAMTEASEDFAEAIAHATAAGDSAIVAEATALRQRIAAVAS